MKSALLVATARACENDRGDRILSDPYASLFAGAEALHLLTRAGGDQTIAVVAVRTRWFDERVLAAIRRGIRTIVVCGAGFDARPHRLRFPADILVIEIDREDVISHKRDKLPRTTCTVERVVGSFDDASGVRALDAALAKHRVAPRSAKLFVLEGLLPYLEPKRARSLVTALIERSPPGSILICDHNLPFARGHAELDVFAAEGFAMRDAIDVRSLLRDREWSVTKRHLGDACVHYSRVPIVPRRVASTALVEAVRGAPLREKAPADLLARFFDGDASPDDPDVLWYRTIARAEGGPVLDFGSGTGRVAIPLLRDGHRVVACEPAPSMRRLYRAKLAHEPAEVRRRTATKAANVGLVIFAFATLNSIRDWRGAIARAARLLRPQGALALDIIDASRVPPSAIAPRAAHRGIDPWTGAPYVRWDAADEPLDGTQRIFGYYALGRERLAFERSIVLPTVDDVRSLAEREGLQLESVEIDAARRGQVFIRARKRS